MQLSWRLLYEVFMGVIEVEWVDILMQTILQVNHLMQR